jgi:DNA-binding transcriptional ArsR family regulator
MTAGELASRFDCAWSTTTRHLQKLEGAGLVRVTQDGRERRYELDSERLSGVTGRFLDAVR